MRRRDFIKVIGGAAAAWPLAAHAQPPDRIRLVGVLMGFSESDPIAQSRLAAFRDALTKLGWTEDSNLRIELRWGADDPDRMSTFAKDLVNLRPDTILAHSLLGTASVQRESRTIPIVFVSVSDPIGSGFVASLARPGGNLTGLLYYETSIVSKWLSMLKEMAPRLARAALVANPRTAPYDYFLRTAEAAAPSLAIEIVPSRVENTADIENAVESVAGMPDSGLVIPPDSTMLRNRNLIVALRSAIACPRSTTTVLSSRPVASCPMALRIRANCFNRRRPMLIVFCGAKNLVRCQCRRRRSIRPLSTLRQQRHSASPCRPVSWSPPTR